jgi:O-antigen ligase
LAGRWTTPSFRLPAITAGVDVFLAHPFLGVGFNGFGGARHAVIEDWVSPSLAENGLSRAMNQYVQTATDGGAPALFFLVLFVLFTSLNAVRIMRWAEATPELIALQLWLISIFVGNQGALWLLSDTGSGFFTFAVAGLTARASALAATSSASRLRVATAAIR